jgi:hypothetical protein
MSELGHVKKSAMVPEIPLTVFNAMRVARDGTGPVRYTNAEITPAVRADAEAPNRKHLNDADQN